jgi:signal transduction histidine kinase/CheY-like chemotaxis protein
MRKHLKKNYLFFSIVILLLILVDLYYLVDTQSEQINFQKHLLMQQAETSGSLIEQTGNNFESEINYILFSEDISNIFRDKEINEDHYKKLEVFYSKYYRLITGIRIFDSKNNVFSLYRNQKEEFIKDYYISQQQEELVSRLKIIGENGTYRYLLPVFKDNQVYGNLEVSVNLVNYVGSVLKNYKVETTLWQWLVDANGQVLMNNHSDKPFQFESLKVITDSLALASPGFLRHKVSDGSKSWPVLTVFYPVHILEQDLGIAFSLNTDVIIQSTIKRTIIMVLFSLIILAFMILIFRQSLVTSAREKKILIDSEKSLRQVIDLLPIGIIILNKEKTIKTINQTAINILNIRPMENLIGQNISDRFLFPENYLEPDLSDNAFDSHHFIYYKKEGYEVVILKKEIPIQLGGEENIVEAFIDVTPIEKARKLEIASNNAKSEFLAKMSHEIRTPMNGIIGMAEALTRQELPAEQSEQVSIIRKSAELLMTILNDILDYSKIEAGKMMVEDIPFRLREEINWALELYRVMAAEKGIDLTADVASNVNENLIGDPFKLRQILSNLLTNAIKFTPSGKILVTVRKVEDYSGNITLSFAVEDTGIGIPPDKIKHIFGSFSQADGSTTRKYGGTGLGTTIAKQLVELLNGEISVESPSSISTSSRFPGAKFAFTIEVFINDPLQKKYNFSTVTDYSQIRALVVTNESENEKVLFDTLKNIGAKYTVFSDRTGLVEQLKHEKENGPHLIILLDTNFQNGFSLAKKLQESALWEQYLILLISARDKQGNFIRCRQSGIDHYLVKPFDPSEIFDIIQNRFTSIDSHSIAKPILTSFRKNISILLAEDNHVNQIVAQTIFKSLGFEISVVANGLEAVEAATHNYDIIFMDVMMPEMDGLQATHEIRKAGYKGYIVAMTASAGREDRTRALEAGMNDYVTKPVKLDAVKTILIRYFSE